MKIIVDKKDITAYFVSGNALYVSGNNKKYKYEKISRKG